MRTRFLRRNQTATNVNSSPTTKQITIAHITAVRHRRLELWRSTTDACPSAHQPATGRGKSPRNPPPILPLRCPSSDSVSRQIRDGRRRGGNWRKKSSLWTSGTTSRSREEVEVCCLSFTDESVTSTLTSLLLLFLSINKVGFAQSGFNLLSFFADCSRCCSAFTDVHLWTITRDSTLLQTIIWNTHTHTHSTRLQFYATRQLRGCFWWSGRNDSE